MIFNPIVSGGGGSAPFFEIAPEEIEHYLFDDPESAILAVIYTNPPPSTNTNSPCLILPLTNVISSAAGMLNVEFYLQDAFHYYNVSIGGGTIYITNEEHETILNISSHGVETSSGWSVRLFVYKDKTT